MGGFAAKTSHDNTVTDPALVLFHSYADRKDYASLVALCLDRLATADCDASTLRWRKDLAIAKALQGEFAEALKVLCSAAYLAERVTGTPRVKYENEFGLVLVEYHRPVFGLDRFHCALAHTETPWQRAGVEHNIGRAYAAQGEMVKAGEYFKRALDFARQANDIRLEFEVCESLIEFRMDRHGGDRSGLA